MVGQLVNFGDILKLYVKLCTVDSLIKIYILKK